jgi:Cu+-exporting ATPase
MKTISGLTIALVVAAFPVAVQAADVSLSDTHLCCVQCVTAVAKALKGVKGVSDAKCDREKSTVTFKATDKKAAQAGLNALVGAGFYGTAKVDAKAVKLPSQKIKAGTKATVADFRGPHMCCGACDKAVKKAVKSVKGVGDVGINRERRSVSISGSDVEVAAVIAALNKAGFSARYVVPRKKKKAE